MMDYPLLLTNFMQHAAKYYPGKEIVSVYATGTFRYTYADWHKRTSQLAAPARFRPPKRRPGGLLLSEQSSPSGALLRRSLHGRRSAYAQYPPVR